MLVLQREQRGIYDGQVLQNIRVAGGTVVYGHGGGRELGHGYFSVLQRFQRDVVTGSGGHLMVMWAGVTRRRSDGRLVRGEREPGGNHGSRRFVGHDTAIVTGVLSAATAAVTAVVVLGVLPLSPLFLVHLAVCDTVVVIVVGDNNVVVPGVPQVGDRGDGLQTNGRVVVMAVVVMVVVVHFVVHVVVHIVVVLDVPVVVVIEILGRGHVVHGLADPEHARLVVFRQLGETQESHGALPARV